MLLVVITLLLVAVGVVSYWYGAWKLSRYAARISGGLSIGVLLFPPITFWFAFYKLEQEGKEFPTTMWLFGMISSILLLVVFWTPISMVATGRMDELDAPTGVAETAVAEYGAKEAVASDTPPLAPAENIAPANPGTNNAGTNNAGTNNAGTNNAGTNNAVGTNNAPATNGAAPAATNGAAPAEAATNGAAQ